MTGIFGQDSLDTVAKILAGEHLQDDPLIQAVYLIPDGNEIRLLEVTPSVAANGEILPFRFTEDVAGGIPYKSLVVLLNPADWARQDTLPWPPELDPATHSLVQLYP